MRVDVRVCTMLALIVGLLATRPISAQERAGGAKKEQGMKGDMMMSMRSMGDCPMMGAMMRGPGAALSRRKALGLSDAQVQRLEALRASETQAMKQPMDSMTALHRRMAALADAEQLDESAVRAEFDRLSALHTEMGMAMMRATHDVRALLTPEQRKTLAAGSGAGMGMRGMSGQDMSGCPMMGGMMGHMSDGMKSDSGGRAEKDRTGKVKTAPMDHHGMQMPAPKAKPKPKPR